MTHIEYIHWCIKKFDEYIGSVQDQSPASDYDLVTQFHTSVKYVEKVKDGVTTVLTTGQASKFETYSDIVDSNVKYTKVWIIPPHEGFFNTPEKVEFDSYS